MIQKDLRGKVNYKNTQGAIYMVAINDTPTSGHSATRLLLGGPLVSHPGIVNSTATSVFWTTWVSGP